MNVLQTDYSNLFAAGLRVIESRSTGRVCSPVFTVSSASIAEEEDVVSPNKSSRFPTNLWRRVSPRKQKTSTSSNASFLADDTAKPRIWHRRSKQEQDDAPLDDRIWDWSTSVYHATTLREEADREEHLDPFLEDKVDPVDTPLPTRATFLVALSGAAASHEQQQQHRRSPWSPQWHHHPYSAPLRESSSSTCQWELASATSPDESGIDDDWRQFRVEWIDFDVDGSR